MPTKIVVLKHPDGVIIGDELPFEALKRYSGLAQSKLQSWPSLMKGEKATLLVPVTGKFAPDESAAKPILDWVVANRGRGRDEKLIPIDFIKMGTDFMVIVQAVAFCDAFQLRPSDIKRRASNDAIMKFKADVNNDCLAVDVFDRLLKFLPVDHYVVRGVFSIATTRYFDNTATERENKITADVYERNETAKKLFDAELSHLQQGYQRRMAREKRIASKANKVKQVTAENGENKAMLGKININVQKDLDATIASKKDAESGITDKKHEETITAGKVDEKPMTPGTTDADPTIAGKVDEKPMTPGTTDADPTIAGKKDEVTMIASAKDEKSTIGEKKDEEAMIGGKKDDATVVLQTNDVVVVGQKMDLIAGGQRFEVVVLRQKVEDHVGIDWAADVEDAESTANFIPRAQASDIPDGLEIDQHTDTTPTSQDTADVDVWQTVPAGKKNKRGAGKVKKNHP